MYDTLGHLVIPSTLTDDFAIRGFIRETFLLEQAIAAGEIRKEDSLLRKNEIYREAFIGWEVDNSLNYEAS
tara:strand:+ start:819 stop:1031 length:213 start_codon:yes stop_codon:yes gene_type:complete